MRTLALFCLALLIGVPGMSFSQASDASQFDPSEIRETTTRLIAALQDTDPTAWVYMFTKGCSSFGTRLSPCRGQRCLAGNGQVNAASFLSGHLTESDRRPREPGVHVRGIHHGLMAAHQAQLAVETSTSVIVWRKETNRQWRVAQEVFVPDTPSEVTSARLAKSSRCQTASKKA